MGLLESDMTERLHFHFSLSCTGEGNGNPLQCSCLENPRDGKPGGLLSVGSHRVGHDWSDLAAAESILKYEMFSVDLFKRLGPFWKTDNEWKKSKERKKKKQRQNLVFDLENTLGKGSLLLLLLLLLLSRFSRVRLCATPETAAHQAPPSLGFSRQEHWSGLPFPSPMHESENWKWSRSVVSDS